MSSSRARSRQGEENHQPATILLDSGATHSFITARAAKRAGLEVRKSEPMVINGLAGFCRTSKEALVTVYGGDNYYQTIRMAVLPSLPMLPKVALTPKDLGIRRRDLADSWPQRKRPIDAAIGQNALLSVEFDDDRPRIRVDSQPKLLCRPTKLGIVVSGEIISPELTSPTQEEREAQPSDSPEPQSSGELTVVAHTAVSSPAEDSTNYKLPNVTSDSEEAMVTAIADTRRDAAVTDKTPPTGANVNVLQAEQALMKWCELEGLGLESPEDSKDQQKHKLTQEERQAVETFRKHKEFVEDRYQVGLTFKTQPSGLNNNRHVAAKQFQQQERRFVREPNYGEGYRNAMQELIESGDVELCPTPLPDGNGYFLPHSCVTREDKATTKVRIVFNGSSKSKGNFSLNDFLHTGPNANHDILSILLAFRQRPVAVSADVRKMYLNIQIREEDRDYLRFLWRPSSEEPVREYRFVSLPFGIRDAPFVAQETVEEHVQQYEQQNPEAVKMLVEQRYMDDIFGSVENSTEGRTIVTSMRNIMLEGGFHLVKWLSNDPSVVDAVPEEDRLPRSVTIGNGGEHEESDSIKALGVKWTIDDDELSVQPGGRVNEEGITKRVVASNIAMIFDPLQISLPFLVDGKRILQDIWVLHSDEAAEAKSNGATPQDILNLRKRQWDQPLPKDLAQEFITWRDQIPHLEHLKVPRCVVDKDRKVTSRQIHVFSDASPNACGAAAYFRATYESGPPTVRLLCAKSKVAPRDLRHNVPRLELLGALIGTRLATTIQKSLNLRLGENISYHFWCDSSVALCWIQGGPHKWVPWVSNRVLEIITTFPKSLFKHVSGTENPADLTTKGIPAKDCPNHSLWLHGPTWLSEDPSVWPDRKFHLNDDDQEAVTKEVYRPRKPLMPISMLAAMSDAKTDILLGMVSKFSHLKTLLRTEALFRMKERGGGLPTITDVNMIQSLCNFVQAVQQEAYADVYAALVNEEEYNAKWKHQDMNVIIGNDSLLRVKGRFPDNSNLEAPLLLPHDHHLTKLIVRDIHHTHMHAGPEWTLSFFMRKFWCPKARRTIKSILRQCTLCTRFKGKTIEQVMAPLPRFRVEPETRPFSLISVDYAGPLMAVDKGVETKTYILILTCMCLRAVHLELVEDMSTEKFISALRRFMARRGRPQVIYSDNARSFKLAAKELGAFNKILNDRLLPPRLRDDGIKWVFNAPKAPWWGALHERMVRSVKECLRAALFKSRLDFDGIRTALVEAEGVVNSRPLGNASDDPSDPRPVTPADLVQGYNPVEPPFHGDLVELNLPSMKLRWRRRLHLQRVMMHRFVKDYVASLRPRQRWYQNKDNVRVGELVLVSGPGKRLTWPLAMIVEVHEGRDGRIRAVTLRTKEGVLTRPVQRLVPLELNAQDEQVAANE